MIITIVGDLGSGKTLTATYLNRLGYNTGYTLFTNYNLFNIPFYKIRSNEDLNFVKDMESKKKLLTLDEQWLNSDARRSSSTMNLFQSKRVLQSRKFRADIIITTQDIDQLDKRIRKVTNIIIEPSIIMRDENNIPKVLQWDWYQCKTGKTKTLFVKVGNSVFYYDSFSETEEMIGDNTLEDFITQYWDFEGSQKALRSILVVDEGVKKGDAQTVIDYIFSLRGTDYKDSKKSPSSK